MIFLTKSRAETFLEGSTFGAFGDVIMVVAHHCFVSIKLFWMSWNVHPTGNQSSQCFWHFGVLIRFNYNSLCENAQKMIFLTKSRAGTFLEGSTFGAFGDVIMVVAHHCFVSIKLFWMSWNVHPTGNQSSQCFWHFGVLIRFNYNSLCENAQKMIFLTKSRAGTFLEGSTFGAFGDVIMVVAHHCFVSIKLFWMSWNVHPTGNQSSQCFWHFGVLIRFNYNSLCENAQKMIFFTKSRAGTFLEGSTFGAFGDVIMVVAHHCFVSIKLFWMS